MILSHYVVKTKHEEEEVLFNTVTKTMLPIVSTENTLRDNSFLQGQEQEAIDRALFSMDDKLCFNINPTWECTLRCKHCCVLTQLVPKQRESVDIDGLITFTDRMLSSHPYRSLLFAFAGGEPLLRANEINQMIERTQLLIQEKFPAVAFNTTLTTNATLPLDDSVQKTLSLLTSIVISIDGNKKEHNDQRHAYKDSFDPYETSIANIRHMLDLGLLSKIKVQATLADDILTREYAAEFMRTFLRMGIDDIKVGSIHPTNVYKKSTDNYLADLRTGHIRPIPCCKYRYGAVYSIDASNKIYDSVWEWSRAELGTIYDTPERIYHAQQENIKSQFPCFKDKNCMDCPAIGLCWGGCTNGVTLIGNQPSRYCDQQRMINVIKDTAEANTITKLGGCKIKRAG